MLLHVTIYKKTVHDGWVFYHIASMLTLPVRARRQPVNHIIVIDVVVVQVGCYLHVVIPCYQFEEPSRKNSETNRWMIIMETLPPWQVNVVFI